MIAYLATLSNETDFKTVDYPGVLWGGLYLTKNSVEKMSTATVLGCDHCIIFI